MVARARSLSTKLFLGEFGNGEPVSCAGLHSTPPARALVPLLYGVTAWNVVSLAGAIIFVIAIRTVATLIPALNAAQVERWQVLGEELLKRRYGSCLEQLFTHATDYGSWPSPSGKDKWVCRQRPFAMPETGLGRVGIYAWLRDRSRRKYLERGLPDNDTGNWRRCFSLTTSFFYATLPSTIDGTAASNQPGS
jgi:hypothetical protein